MTRYLSVYMNCSRGGMASVYYNRAKANPLEIYDLVFLHDKGGVSIFNELSNVNVRICPPNRLTSYINHLTRTIAYKEIRVTTCPDAIEPIDLRNNPVIVYEFHTPFRTQMEREAQKLDFSKINLFAVPSNNSARILTEVLPGEEIPQIDVWPNVLDLDFLQCSEEGDQFNWNNSIPVLWIGRFDNQKNVNDFLRTMSLLPSNYHGVAVISLNDDGVSFADFMGDVYAYRLENNISILHNLSKRQMRNLYHSVLNHDGVFYSTAVDESFGYTVAEASAIGLSTVAFEVGALPEHKSANIHFIPVGDNVAARNKILSVTLGEDTVNHTYRTAAE